MISYVNLRKKYSKPKESLDLAISPNRGSNPRPCPCEGHVITTTPLGLLFKRRFFQVTLPMQQVYSVTIDLLRVIMPYGSVGTRNMSKSGRDNRYTIQTRLVATSYISCSEWTE